MRRVIRLMGWTACALLMLLALSTLVEGPPVADAPPPPPPVRAALAATMPAAPSAAPTDAQSRREQATAPRPADSQGMQAHQHDRNGHPLTAQSYTRTVYQAFPPERGFA